MLKKKNIFVVIFSLIFCLSMFGVNLMTNAKTEQIVASAETVTAVSAPKLIEEMEGNGWAYDGMGGLSITSVNWDGPLVLSCNTEIVMTGENIIDGGINANSIALTISGTGSLILSANGGGVIQSCDSLTLGEGVVAKDSSGNEITNLAIIPSMTYVKFEKPAPATPEHSHIFEYSVSGSELVANCNVSDCTITEKVSMTLRVEDISFGETVDFQIDGLSNFNKVTGLNLTKDSFSCEYYKVETEGAVTGGSLVSDPGDVAGSYYLKATISSANEDVNGLSLTCAFDVLKAEGDVTLESEKTITYNGSEYDVSELFSFDENAGTITYTLVTDGLSGETDIATGTLEGSMLTITKCGIINVKAESTGNGSYAGTTAVSKLIIERKNLVAGNESGQVQIVYSIGVLDGVEYFTDSWIESNLQHPQAEVRNNLGGGDVTITYWTDSACSIPTTIDDHGASVENGAPQVMGVYFVKAEIEKSNFYNSISITKEIKVKRTITCEIIDDKAEITYKDLSGGKYDLSQMIEIDDEALDSVEEIIYYYEIKDVGSTITIPDGLFEIPPISDSGDSYDIKIIVRAKSESLYSHIGTDAVLKVNKINLDANQISIASKEFDAEQISDVVVGDNPFNGVVSVQYYLDAACEELVLDNGGIPVNAGKYYAKVTVGETTHTKETIKVLEVEITAVELQSITWSENNYVYNGSEQKIEAYYLDVKGNRVDLNVFVDFEFKDVCINDAPYTYTATASFANGEINYILPNVVTNQYQIKPMQVEIEIFSRNAKYGRVNMIPLSSKIISGEIFEGDNVYSLKIKDLETITSTTAVGKYEIIGEAAQNSNYVVNFKNTAYYYVKNIIINESDMISDWTYGQTASVPMAQDTTGAVVQFAYYELDQTTLLDEQPKMPGTYYLKAWVGENPETDIIYAEGWDTFTIDKIEITIPQSDTTVYTYNGLPQSYKVIDIDDNNSKLYTIGENTFRDAGTHKVQLTIKNFDIYRWPNNERIYEFDFVINKKIVEKPAVDNRVYKYNGNALTYAIATSSDYRIDNAKQTNVGRYKVILTLLDVNNTMWSDGTTDELEYDFVINQNQITNSVIVDSDGKELDSKDVSIINVSGGGLSPEVELKAEVIDSNDDEEIKTVKVQLGTLLKKYDKIFKVIDVSTILNGEVIQSENNITLKMLVPEKLVNADFRLYHIHIDENGKEVISEIDYSDVDENGYIVFQTDKLSSFVFVYEQTPLVGLMVTFIVLFVVMLALLIVQLIWFRKNKSGNKAVVASAVPVFYVVGELVSTIIFGVLFGLLVLANIVLLILNLKMRKSNLLVQKTTKKTTKKTAKAK